MEKLIKLISTLAPFLASYPVWVKMLFAIWIISGAVLFVGLVFGKQTSNDQSQKEKKTQQGKTNMEPILIIKGVRAYELQNYKVKVKVTANVNGIEFHYPSGTKAEWLEIGKNMSAQSFILPPIKNGYEISFTMKTLHNGKEKEMISQWVESIKSLPFSGQYELHAFHPASQTRSGEVSASISYEIKEE